MVERTERLAEILQDAMLIAEDSRDPRLLRHLHAARSSLRAWIDASAAIRVDVLAARVFVHGKPAPFTPAELALVIALTLDTSGIGREALAEMLYPGHLPGRSTSVIKVYVHRARRRVGSDGFIRYERGRYRLGDEVDVDVDRLAHEVLRLRLTSEPLSEDMRDRLEQFRTRLTEGRPPFVLEWEWFEETERKLCELARDVTVLLAKDALSRDRYERAIAFAHELARLDPLDELAPEIAIRSFLLAGNRTSAVLEYRKYALVLEREIAAMPPEGLRALLETRT